MQQPLHACRTPLGRALRRLHETKPPHASAGPVAGQLKGFQMNTPTIEQLRAIEREAWRRLMKIDVSTMRLRGEWEIARADLTEAEFKQQTQQTNEQSTVSNNNR